MKITLRVSYADGSAVETDATTADLVRLEEHFQISVARLEAELRLTWLCWLAWHSLHRHAKTGADFDSWLQSVDEVAIAGSEATPAPLESPAST